MHPLVRCPSRRAAAYTLVEMLVVVSLSAVLGSIIYTVGSEALLSFARNISINRSYSDARLAIDRMALMVETAAHTPVLITNDGLTVASTTAAAPRAAGIRFYRTEAAFPYVNSSNKLDTASTYPISSGTSADTKLILKVPAKVDSPQIDDLITVASIGFEGIITATTDSTVYSNSDRTITYSFTGGTLASQCYPALSGTVSLTGAGAMQFYRVAFVAVGNQLRYYRRAPKTSAAVSTASNYEVIATLVSNPTDTTQLLPFSLGPSPTINVRVCAEGPDYNKNKLGTANTFTQLQTCLGSRNPLLLRTTSTITF